MKKYILLTIAIVSLYTLSFSQENQIVHITFKNKNVEYLSNILKTKYDINLYYEPVLLDSLRVSNINNSKTIKELIKSICKDKPYSCSFFQNNIFITGTPLLTKLDSTYFNTASDKEYQEKMSIYKPEKASKVKTDKEKTNSHEVVYIGKAAKNGKTKRADLTGYVRDGKSGEPIIGLVVYVEDLQTGTTTDNNGYYYLNLPKGPHQLTFHSLGMEDIMKQIVMYSDGSLDVEMYEKLTQLQGIDVIAEKEQNVLGLQIGMDKLDMKTVKQIPAMMGEVDIMKAVLLLPGVQTVGEGASGFNVRGGSTDQNLILINAAPVFNPSHLFGFFSVFNPDNIKDFKLYKSGIPARYGGRISSVFDVTTRIGNRKKYSASGGISPVTGRVLFEGPIIKDKSSFILSGRSTYSDWLLDRFKKPEIRNSDASFYDVFGKISHEINDYNQIELSSYYSNDFFKLNSDTTYKYQNRNASLSWKHIFNTNLIGTFSGVYSSYSYDMFSMSNKINAFELNYNLDYRELKADFSFFPNEKHKIYFGSNSIIYELKPGNFYPKGEESLVKPVNLQTERASENAIYVSDEYKINERFSLHAGIRYSLFMLMGPQTVYNYTDDALLETYNIEDSVFYNRGSIIKTYSGPEFRFSGRLILNKNSSVKLSYNRMRQYLHMLSNTTAVSPTDTWKLSDKYISPQIGDQFAIGYYHDLFNGAVETSTELYYKNIKNIIEYKGGAQLLLNENIETDLINARGRAYGMEILLKKKMGRFNGWLGYTYSRIEIKADGEHKENRINNGAYFPASYDKPHDVTLVANYKFSRRLSASTNLLYNTGRPITYPVAKYSIRNANLLHYSYRNEYRVPDYFRWDLSLTLEGNLRSKKLAHGSWTLSCFNVTGRKNVYSIYFVSRSGKVQGYKLSVFGRPIYTLTYNFKF